MDIFVFISDYGSFNTPEDAKYSRKNAELTHHPKPHLSMALCHSMK